jgi:cyclopropane fatty-acyl-phospholipid synthase-like methyltransferase
MRDHRKAVVAQGYNALGEDYVAWAASWADPARYRMLDEFSARMASGAHVLDLGCGAGLASTQILASRFAVTGVDFSEVQLEAARRNVPEASFLHADLTQIDFPPESFDGVTAFYSIIHVPRDEHGPLFERVARWLVPGGLFLATLGSGDDPDWMGEWLGQPMFFSSHDADGNRRLLTATNFDLLIDDVMETPEPEGPVPFLWVLAQRRA